jgi:hypothetical protein
MHHAKAAVDLSGRSSETLATLAAACAEAGQFDDAVSIAEEALRLSADRSRDDATVRAMQTRLELYRAGKPYHETATATTAPSTSP